ncbi:hypothetical protein [Ectothiorhodospira shaposhnikovii]|uniref:hypothetical protein n=1 Tax=Ectothiorhodospira shaposhnikovii TaxID=1054 RepID=UPI001EE7CF97|nr:hypothetical protein [Ectothiorhodospira shaposhnikovii]MCG5512870.1 hypothetical protein [Ectothiorhodospira shaposhnikovii]
MPSLIIRTHQVLTTIFVIWMLVVTTAILYKTFWQPVEIPSSTVAALTAVLGLPTIAVGLWKARWDWLMATRKPRHD